MSVQSQKKNMARIAELAAQDLSYIYGDPEGRHPAGAKKLFLGKSRVFLRTLAKDLGFSDFRINTCAGGIAVAGEVGLHGQWENGTCIYVNISQPYFGDSCCMYRTARSLSDSCGGINQYISREAFVRMDYEYVLRRLLALKGETDYVRTAA